MMMKKSNISKLERLLTGAEVYAKVPDPFNPGKQMTLFDIPGIRLQSMDFR